MVEFKIGIRARVGVAVGLWLRLGIGEGSNLAPVHIIPSSDCVRMIKIAVIKYIKFINMFYSSCND